MYITTFELKLLILLSVSDLTGSRRQDRGRDRSEERSSPPGYMDIPPKEDVSLLVISLLNI